MACKRSAVRSRLAPPAFARFASFGWASPEGLSWQSEGRLPRHSPEGDGGLLQRARSCFASRASAGQARKVYRSEVSEGCPAIARRATAGSFNKQGLASLRGLRLGKPARSIVAK